MEYDLKHRLDDLLQITDFKNEHTLVYDINECIKQLRQCESLEVYAKAGLIEKLIHILHGTPFHNGTIKFAQIDFDGEGFDYEDIYCLSIDDEYGLWVQPAYYIKESTNECILIGSSAVLAYVYQEDCKQDLINKLEEKNVPTLLFGFGED